MSNYQERIIYGMSNIHVAVFDAEQKTYGNPVAILGAKQIWRSKQKYLEL